MAWPFDRPVTADTTRVTADSTVSRPLAAMAARLHSLFPPAWSSTGPAPIRDALFAGVASTLTWSNAVTGYTRLQTRLATATGLWLDLAAYDFFGLRFQRRKGEADAAFSARIRAEIIRPRSTRAAVIRAVTDLTGVGPDIIELYNPGDVGAYDAGTFGYAGEGAIQPPVSGFDDVHGGYDIGTLYLDAPVGPASAGGGIGCYGSLELPNQMLITVRRPPPVSAVLAAYGGYDVGTMAFEGGTDNLPVPVGYDDGRGGLDAGDFYFEQPSQPKGYSAGSGGYAAEEDIVTFSDQDIYQTITQTAAGGVIAWTQIRGV